MHHLFIDPRSFTWYSCSSYNIVIRTNLKSMRGAQVGASTAYGVFVYVLSMSMRNLSQLSRIYQSLRKRTFPTLEYVLRERIYNGIFLFAICFYFVNFLPDLLQRIIQISELEKFYRAITFLFGGGKYWSKKDWGENRKLRVGRCETRRGYVVL